MADFFYVYHVCKNNLKAMKIHTFSTLLRTFYVENILYWFFFSLLLNDSLNVLQ
jgi:hypothetical protein